MTRSEDSQHLSRRTFLKRAGTLAVGITGASLLVACGAPAEPTSPGVSASGASSAGAAASTAPSAATSAVPATVSSAPAAAGAKTVQLYALAWQPSTIEATTKSVDAWNQTNGDRIKLEYVQGDWGKARDFITTSVAGGVAPQIIQGITAWGNEYGQQGSYLDLAPLIDASDLKNDLHPRALAAAITPFGNQVYGLPWCWEVGVMYINADRFTQNGIPLPSKGWSWDEFHTASKKLTKSPEYYGLGVNLGGSQATEDVIAWMWQNGAEVMAQINGEWKIDLEPARDALVLWKQMVAEDQIVSPDSFGGTVNLFEGFPIGTFSTMQNGCWARQLINEAKPAFKWQMVPLPANKRRANSSEPQTWSITAQTKKDGTTDAAWEAVQWMSNKENQSEIAFADGLLPTRQSAMKEERFNTAENYWDVVQSEAQYGRAYPKHPAWSEFDERVLGPNIQQYLQGQIPLDQLIKTATDEGTKLLAKYKK